MIVSEFYDKGNCKPIQIWIDFCNYCSISDSRLFPLSETCNVPREFRWVTRDRSIGLQRQRVILKQCTFLIHVDLDHSPEDAHKRRRVEYWLPRAIERPDYVFKDSEDGRLIYYKLCHIPCGSMSGEYKFKLLKVVLDDYGDYKDVVTWLIIDKLKFKVKKEELLYVSD